MGHLFKKGQRITSSSASEYKVEEFLGAGGQGEVYRVSARGKDWALKWYFKNQASGVQKKNLEDLVLKGAPTDEFLWPLEVVTSRNIDGFGYVMPLRPKNYKNMVDLMTRRIDPSFFVLATAGFKVVENYFILHTKGMAYMDINFGNVFFDPQNGDVLICDNDNVTFDKTKDPLVAGTMRFMAPEIVREEALPSSDTDRFSLAVLLFYMFFISHPLEGKRESDIMCLDAAAMRKLYGESPLFIFNSKDVSNRPDPNRHKNAQLFWDVYPQFFKDLFTRVFTDGLIDPENGRVRESEWRSALMRLRDSIVYCPKCGCENFYEGTTNLTGGPKSPKCWNCKVDIPLPTRIKIGTLVIMLNYNTKLYPYHLDPLSYDLSKPIAEMAQHPSNPQIWGLKNTSDRNWKITKPDGSTTEVIPGKSVALGNGVRINFGRIEAEMKV